MCQLAENSWSHFCYSPFITREINWQSTAGHTFVTLQTSPVCQLADHTGHTSVTLHSTPVCQMAEHSWSNFCYSQVIARGSAGNALLVTLLLLSTHRPCVNWQSTLVTLLLLSTHHPWISWQSTAVHTSVALNSSHVDQLAEHSWSHLCYSPLITQGSTDR